MMQDRRKHESEPRAGTQQEKHPSQEDNGVGKKTDIKDAHASGTGSLEKSDEKQIEDFKYEQQDDDDVVY